MRYGYGYGYFYASLLQIIKEALQETISGDQFSTFVRWRDRFMKVLRLLLSALFGQVSLSTGREQNSAGNIFICEDTTLAI